MNDDNKRLKEIEVNGLPVQIGFEKLVALDVLRLALKEGIIGSEPEKFVLESMNPTHTFKHEEWVDFSDYKEFTAEMSGPTPVAFGAN